MKKPPVDKVLSTLKPFQRRTVDHAFKRLFLSREGSSRFLVADEVGLGKTLVARGIIVKVIDHLWNKVDRIDIVYICSNQNIARANLPKLQMGQESLSSATRLTLLAKELSFSDVEEGFFKNKLNFVAFTPSTSFEFGRSTGKREEREVLFHLLREHCGSQTTALKNLLQGTIKNRDSWRNGLKQEIPLEQTITKRFDQRIGQDSRLMSDLLEILEKWFKRYSVRLPIRAREERNQIIGRLRRILAEVSVEVLEPDLVILDEFQRFKPLLETCEDKQTEAAQLAQALFGVAAHDGRLVRTLLLSATPYKPYTSDAELGQEDHYEDFIETTKFLFNADGSSVERLKVGLAGFGDALKSIAQADTNALSSAIQFKNKIEESLSNVMARTERASASRDYDSMVKELRPHLGVESSDVEQYIAVDSLFRTVGAQDPLMMWKSAPYLINFMSNYRFNEHLRNAIIDDPGSIAEEFSRFSEARLSANAIRQLEEIATVNASLRYLMRTSLDTGMWQLLWLPPTIAYWPLEGPFKTASGATKTLMFSAWNVVPDAVSALMSYEAERRMLKRSQVKSYENPDEQQGQLLTFEQSSSGGRSSHRNLLTLLPCLPLSDLAHPLEHTDGRNVRARIRSTIKRLLADSGLPNDPDAPIDNDWIWAAPVLLDPGLRTFLRRWRDREIEPLLEIESGRTEQSDHFNAYLTDLIEFDISQLGRRPDGLEEVLTDVALGSPAILITRTMQSFGISDDCRRTLAFEVAGAFRNLFNRPAVISLLRTLAYQNRRKRSSQPYWRLVLNYCRQGCLQAVLDEHWHILWEQRSWSPTACPDEIATECADSLYKSVHPVPSRVHAHFFEADGQRRVSREEIRIRTVFALRFGHVTSDDEQKSISQEAVRNAFNSPFRPFILASTSIGQEGLDFHPWCHRLLHWNLPGNPVDLEQREGRVHRYDGHAVRKNVVSNHAERALACWKRGENLWDLLFKYAESDARKNRDSDLVPHWIAHGENSVERIVPLLPYSREIEQFERLKTTTGSLSRRLRTTETGGAA